MNHELAENLFGMIKSLKQIFCYNINSEISEILEISKIMKFRNVVFFEANIVLCRF